MNENIILTNEILIEATQIYYDYIEKYSSAWDELESKASEETFGQLIFFNYQLKDIQNADMSDENNKAIIKDCLIEITKFSQYIIKNLKHFV